MRFWQKEEVRLDSGAKLHETVSESGAWETYRLSVKVYDDRTPMLVAELEALEAPADLFQISKNFADGSFTVLKWRKQIVGAYERITTLQGYGPPVPIKDYRAVVGGHEIIKSGLPSHKAAESWIKAYLDPSTNRISYDAEGNRIKGDPA